MRNTISDWSQERTKGYSLFLVVTGLSDPHGKYTTLEKISTIVAVKIYSRGQKLS